MNMRKHGKKNTENSNLSNNLSNNEKRYIFTKDVVAAMPSIDLAFV